MSLTLLCLLVGLFSAKYLKCFLLRVLESNAQNQACRENVLNKGCSSRMFLLSLNVRLITGASLSSGINREVAALRKLATFYLLLWKIQGFDRLPVAKKKRRLYIILILLCGFCF